MRSRCIWCSNYFENIKPRPDAAGISGVCPSCEKGMRVANKKYLRNKKRNKRHR